MEDPFSEFQHTVREANEAAHAALRCAVFVLERARELPPARRRSMIEVLIRIISEHHLGTGAPLCRHGSHEPLVMDIPDLQAQGKNRMKMGDISP